MEAGDKILFEWSKNEELALKISPLDSELKCKYNKNYEYPVDMSEVFAAQNVVMFPRSLKFSFQHKVKYERIIRHRDSGFGPIFVHKLTETNVNRKIMKIPKKIVDALNS